MMKNYVHPNKNNLFIIAELKMELLNSLEEKYASSITELHWVASYLDPSFKNFSFIDDLEYLETKKKVVRKGIHILATDLFNESKTTFSVNTQILQHLLILLHHHRKDSSKIKILLLTFVVGS